jgi:PhzF family phenazine biosynthesis protein
MGRKQLFHPNNTSMNKRKNITTHIVNAFTANGGGGNPAGIVLDADTLSSAEKQAAAAAIGLSETAFVSRSETAGFKLDFFTPTRQIAHCGHATIAAFSYLHQQGLIEGTRTSKETIDGVREIEIAPDGMAFMEQSTPIFTSITEASERMEIMATLGLDPEDLLPGAPIMQVNTGNSFMIIPIAKQQKMSELVPDFDGISRISEARDLIGYYCFTPETGTTDFDASTRMFAPRYGIEEESATGMAAGPLACYLHEVMMPEQAAFNVQQGKFMEPAALSRIQVELELFGGKISSLRAGGYGRMMTEKVVAI